MRLAARHLFMLISLLFVNALLVNAQDLPTEQGLKPCGSFEGGDFDSVSMVNGSLTLHIPLVSYPQRGGKLHLGFSVVYNNPEYAYINHRVNGICPQPCSSWALGTTSTQFASDVGGDVANEALLTVVPDVPSVRTIYGISNNVLYNTVLEADGVVHMMGQKSSNSWIAMDTTGYVLALGTA